MKKTRGNSGIGFAGKSALFMASLALLSQAQAGNVINFDLLPHGTKVGAQLQASGAVFSTLSTGGTPSDAEVISDPSEASSPANILIGGDSSFACFGDVCSESPILIDIVDASGSPRSTNGVCLTLISVGHAQVTVKAFDATGNLLGDTISVVHADGPENGFANQDPVELFRAGIARVSVSVDAPGVKSDGFGIDDVQIDCAPPMAIDIKPRSFPNSINPRNQGVIPVAVLTTDSFDATTINPLSVKFGPGNAVEAHGQGHMEDVDGDGDIDLLLHFRTQDTGISCGDTSAMLTGRSYNGQSVEAVDAIVTRGCN